MADFCQECSFKVWGRDTKDLAGLISEVEVKQGLSVVVLCEGCGSILVDHNGKRIEIEQEESNMATLEQHEEKHDRDNMLALIDILQERVTLLKVSLDGVYQTLEKRIDIVVESQKKINQLLMEAITRQSVAVASPLKQEKEKEIGLVGLANEALGKNDEKDL